MDYQADSKKPKPSSDAILVLKEGQQQQKKKKKGRFSSKKSFWICCSNVEVAAGALGEEKKKNEKEKVHFKLKRYAFLCCSDVEFETEEEKEKVLQYLENNNTKKSCINICCTNLEVGTKSSRSGA